MTKRRRTRPDPRKSWTATLVSLVVALSVLTPACATLRGSYPVEVDGRRQVEIDVGRLREEVPATYLRYFPESLTVRPGDTVRFQLRHSGEPHTVTLGTSVEDLRALASFPKPFERRSGSVHLNEVAVRPCFLDRTAPERVVSYEAQCAPAEQPPFDGRQMYFSSGLLDGSRDLFRMEVAASIRPGAYRFLCLVHPDVMRGTLEVVARDADRPRPGSVMDRAEEEEERAAMSLAAAAREALDATPARAVAGLPPPEGVAGYLVTFGRNTYRIKRGGQVRWSVFGMHTITFGASGAGAGDGLVVERDDGYVPNRAVWTPDGSPRPPTDAQLRSASAGGDPIEIKVVWDGAGHLSSGVLSSRDEGKLRYTVVFARRGTYAYRCLVHPRMRGRVIVT